MTWEAILAVCAGIVAVGGAGAMIYKWITPAIRMSSRVTDLETHEKNDLEALKLHAKKIELLVDKIAELEVVMKNRDENMSRMKEESKLMLSAIMRLIEHELDGNHTDKLKDAKDDIFKYLSAK